MIEKERLEELIKKGATIYVYNRKYIGCCCNNIGAIVNELIAYIFIEHYASNRDCGKFHNQTIKHLKQYWIKEN